MKEGFISERIQRTAIINIEGMIEKVFPLFGPVREMEWAHGWSPEIIYPQNAEAEEHMIFRTKGSHSDNEFYTWIITQYDPEKHIVEYTVSTSERIWFINVTCEPNGDKTKATISYTFTGLTDSGNDLNKEALKEMYSEDLKDWEKAINHYLKTGKQLLH